MDEKTKDKFIVRSVRGPQEAFDLLKQLGDDTFGSQGEALDYLVNLYNIEEGRKKTGRETEIDEFRKHFNRIMDMYLASLALCADAEDRIRDGFAVRMENQEQEIKRLREQEAEHRAALTETHKALEAKQTELDAQAEALAKAKTEREAAVNDHDEREAAIRKQLDMIDTQHKQIAQLTEVKDSQAAEIAKLGEQIASLTAKLENLDDYKQRLSEAHDELQTASARASELSEKLADAKAKLEAADKEKENAVNAAKVKAAQKANDKIEQQQERYSKLQDRYEALEERLKKIEGQTK